MGRCWPSGSRLAGVKPNSWPLLDCLGSFVGHLNAISGLAIATFFRFHGLDESAIDATATKWRFKPGTVEGKPVDVQTIIEVRFKN